MDDRYAEAKYLVFPLYELEYANDIYSEETYDVSFFRYGNRIYPEEVLNSIIESLEWARSNPEFDFKSLNSNITLQNSEIYYFLMKFYDKLSMAMKGK